MEHPSASEAKTESWVALAAQSLLLASAAAAVLLCGVHRQGSMGIFLCGAGVALLVLPPRKATSWTLWALATGMIACASLALLPQALVATPPWRSLLATAEMLPPFGSISLVPSETRFWVLVLAASLLAGLYSLGQPVRSRALLGLALAATIASALYAGASAFAATTGWKAPFDSGATFGFLPNRNHAATLLVTGCLTGIGVVAAGFRERRFIPASIAVAGTSICVWTLIMVSPSRAAIIVLALGLLLWFAGLGRTNRSVPLLVSFAAVGMAAAIFLVASESTVQKRLLSIAPGPTALEVPGPGHTKQDPRAAIFQDTLGILRDYPWTGTGLGTFRFVYPHYARASLRETGAIHPESDWLMLASEAGPLALALVLAAGAALMLNLRGRRRHPVWPLRWAVICAALAGCIHGFVDVPLHRVELGWWVLVLATIGLASPDLEAGKRSLRLQHILFLIGGAGMILLGFRLLQAEWMNGRPLPPFAAEADQARLVELSRSGKTQQAWKASIDAIQRSPMTRELYYQRGVLALAFEGTDGEVDACFETERRLEPNWPGIAIKQGEAWKPVDPIRAAALWWKAVDRQARVESAEGKSGQAGGLALYIRLLSEAADNPALLSAMAPPDDRPADFQLAWLEKSPDVAGALSSLTADETFLKSLDSPQRDRFLAAWFERGNRVSLGTFLAGRPDWAGNAWLVALRGEMANGHHERVVRALCAKFQVSIDLPAPVSPVPVDDLVPDNPVDAFHYLWSRQNEVAARRILLEARESDPSTQQELYRLRAALAARAGNWQQACAELIAHLRAKGTSPLP